MSRTVAGEPETSAAAPFTAAIGLEPRGLDRFDATLGRDWTVGTRAHGGLLLALLVKAGLARLDVEDPGVGPDPVAVGAEFLRAPEIGPVQLHTEVLKLGRTASVIAVRMRQADRLMLTATVTAGRLPEAEPTWSDLPDQPAEPPPEALDPAAGRTVFGLAGSCDLRFDPDTAAFTRGEYAPPLVRGWARPRGEPTDLLFALLAGDILPPTVFNLDGRMGWAPTVQLTALLRAHPAPGWLRVESRSTTVAGQWFDEDTTVVDAGTADRPPRLICQARQIALAPLNS